MPATMLSSSRVQIRQQLQNRSSGNARSSLHPAGCPCVAHRAAAARRCERRSVAVHDAADKVVESSGTIIIKASQIIVNEAPAPEIPAAPVTEAEYLTGGCYRRPPPSPSGACLPPALRACLPQLPAKIAGSQGNASASRLAGLAGRSLGCCLASQSLTTLHHPGAGVAAGRAKAVQQHFESALGQDDFINRVEMALYAFGFTGDNSIGESSARGAVCGAPGGRPLPRDYHTPPCSGCRQPLTRHCCPLAPLLPARSHGQPVP